MRRWKLPRFNLNVTTAARLSLCVAFAALLVQAVPQAHAEEPLYRATAEKPPVSRIIAREMMWTCAGSDCSAMRSGSRPEIVCGAFARRVGTLTAFTVGGTPLGADALALCNKSAR